MNPEQLLDLVCEHQDSIRASLDDELYALLLARLGALAEAAEEDDKAVRRALKTSSSPWFRCRSMLVSGLVAYRRPYRDVMFFGRGRLPSWQHLFHGRARVRGTVRCRGW